MALLRRGSRGDDVARLQRLLTLLGEFDGRIDGIFGPATEAAVRAFQWRNDLIDDGVVGARTSARIDELVLDGEAPLQPLRHAWRERDAAELDVEPPDGAPLPESTDQAESGTIPPPEGDYVGTVLTRAEAEWGRPVVEPPGPGWEWIDEYIRGRDGLQWIWEQRYVRNRQFAWCGAFAAYCYQAAGLSAEIRKNVMPSTYRLYAWAKGTARLLSPDAAARGDIVIVGPEAGKIWGAHITICEFIDGGDELATLEGNARGTGSDGSSYEGVVRQRRPMPQAGLAPSAYRVMHVIRPLAEDFE